MQGITPALPKRSALGMWSWKFVLFMKPYFSPEVNLCGLVDMWCMFINALFSSTRKIVFSLLKTFSVFENMALMIGWLVDNELERTWKEAIMTEFIVIFTRKARGKEATRKTKT
jgi:hypothetical protein